MTTKTCLKCNHERDLKDGADPACCPNCGAYYAKVEAALDGDTTIRIPKVPPRSGGASYAMSGGDALERNEADVAQSRSASPASSRIFGVPAKYFLWGLALLLIVPPLYLDLTTERPEVPWAQQDHSAMAYVMMEGFVKDRLRSPSTAEFPGTLDGRISHISTVGPQIYQIESYVDAQNGFGAMVRMNFVGAVEQTAPGDWSLRSLDLQER